MTKKFFSGVSNEKKTDTKELLRAILTMQLIALARCFNFQNHLITSELILEVFFEYMENNTLWLVLEEIVDQNLIRNIKLVAGFSIDPLYEYVPYEKDIPKCSKARTLLSDKSKTKSRVSKQE